MEKEIIFGMIGIITFYIIIKIITRKSKNKFYNYSDILTNEKYKVTF